MKSDDNYRKIKIKKRKEEEDIRLIEDENF